MINRGEYRNSCTDPESLFVFQAEAAKEGKARSIGVSNFGVRHLQELEAANVGPLPAVNQVRDNTYAPPNYPCRRLHLIRMIYMSSGS